MTFRHTIEVRYGECDMQRVVFNANYLAFVDEAMARWFAATLPRREGETWEQQFDGFDYMVKQATVTWAASSTFGDRLDLDCSVARWGTTSFEVSVVGTAAGADRFTAAVICVSVDDGLRPVAVPELVRQAFAT